MTPAFFILISLVAVLLASVISLLQISTWRRQRELVAHKLERAFHGPVQDATAAVDEPEQGRQSNAYWSIVANLPMAAEIKRSLREAGFAGVQPQLIFAFINLALPAGVLLVCLVLLGLAGLEFTHLLITIAAVILTALLPRWVLRWLATRRRRALSAEIPVVIQLLIMLMDAGLSIEHALRILRTESAEDKDSPLLPEFARELRILLNRVDAGGSLAHELGVISNALGVQELSDLAAVLRQVLRRGGDIRQSLANLAELIEDRRYTRMQERAGVIAGKMSAVMILFMFPALVLFLAGPGFLAIVEGLSNASS